MTSISDSVVDERSTHPHQSLEAFARESSLDVKDKLFAERMDQQDSLKIFRQHYVIPTAGNVDSVDPSLKSSDEEVIYMLSHGLGLQPKKAKEYVMRDMDVAAQLGANGYLKFVDYYKKLLEPMAEVVGAKMSEVNVMHTVTVNLHLLMTSFYQPTETRHKIIIEDKAFPTDNYTAASQIATRGLDPEKSLICMKTQQGEHTLRTEDILAAIETHGDTTALICLPGVHYFTGQLFDIPTITAAAHDKGCYVCWDLSQAVGVVNLNLHDWGVDCAAWCTYKYLNSGPGGIGAAFLHEKHANSGLPKLNGWWSHKRETRYLMDNNLDVIPGIRGYQLTKSSPITCAEVEAGLEIVAKAGVLAIRRKSLLLTGYLEMLLKKYVAEEKLGKETLGIISPEDPHQRGCHMAINIPVKAGAVQQQLRKHGIMVDVRNPDAIRVAPSPLYNSFSEVHTVVECIKRVLSAKTDWSTVTNDYF